MTTKVAVQMSELEAHLAEQLSFLQASAEAFDRGFFGEAKRLATTLRVLLHDTASSKSVLGQLQKKGCDFYQSATPDSPGNLAAYSGLIASRVTPEGGGFVPLLDDSPAKTWSSFETWWGMEVFRDNHGQRLTRRDLVTIAANQDGGAHVDPMLDARYSAISKSNSLGWSLVSSAGETPLGGAELAALRQIAHEVLKTLVPAYTAVQDNTGDYLMLQGVSVVGGSGDSIQQDGLMFQSSALPARIGRNAPCPCGSGKKYKRCHGKLR